MDMGKSQVDKFNERLSKSTKKYVDKQIIDEANLERHKQEYSRYGAEGVKELAEQGNIKEAAVVFSYEGISAFANMFGNSMESAVTRVLDNQFSALMEKKIEAMLESKLTEMLQGFTEGFKKFNTEKAMEVVVAKAVTPEHTQSLIEKAIEQFKQEVFVEEKLTPVEQAVQTEHEPVVEIDWEALRLQEEKEKASKRVGTLAVTESTNSKGSRAYSRLIEPGEYGLQPMQFAKRLGASKEDVEFITPYIIAMLKKYEGQEVKSTDMVRTLNNDFNIKITQATAMWRKIMNDNPNVENTDFGMYMYKEKTFKPTV